MALNLSQHMVRVQPAGQFLDMAYAASFMDLYNFRGRLLQFLRSVLLLFSFAAEIRIFVAVSFLSSFSFPVLF